MRMKIILPKITAAITTIGWATDMATPGPLSSRSLLAKHVD
jgi:hypothetical protein